MFLHSRSAADMLWPVAKHFSIRYLTFFTAASLRPFEFGL